MSQAKLEPFEEFLSGFALPAAKRQQNSFGIYWLFVTIVSNL